MRGKCSINTELLNEFIIKSGKNKTFLAKKVGISRTYFYQKCNGNIPFDTDEIEVLADEINIDTHDKVIAIFFPHLVDKYSTV